MVRHTTFALVSLFACGVASAQQPYFNYGGSTVNPSASCPNGFCGTQSGNCANGNCAVGSYSNGQMICGPNGCYAPGTAPGSVRSTPTNYWPTNYWPANRQYGSQYHTLPYTTPSSSYPGFPSIPSARRDRTLPTAGGYPLFHNQMPTTNNWNYYSPVTGAADPYSSYSGPGVLH
jgi:hypothetical protein